MTDTVVLILCGMSFFSGVCTGWLMWNRPDDEDHEPYWVREMQDRGVDAKGGDLIFEERDPRDRT